MPCSPSTSFYSSVVVSFPLRNTGSLTSVGEKKKTLVNIFLLKNWTCLLSIFSSHNPYIEAHRIYYFAYCLFFHAFVVFSLANIYRLFFLSDFQHIFTLYKKSPFNLLLVLLLVVELSQTGDLYHSYVLVIISVYLCWAYIWGNND